MLFQYSMVLKTNPNMWLLIRPDSTVEYRSNTKMVQKKLQSINLPKLAILLEERESWNSTRECQHHLMRLTQKFTAPTILVKKILPCHEKCSNASRSEMLLQRYCHFHFSMCENRLEKNSRALAWIDPFLKLLSIDGKTSPKLEPTVPTP